MSVTRHGIDRHSICTTLPNTFQLIISLDSFLVFSSIALIITWKQKSKELFNAKEKKKVEYITLGQL